MAAIIFGLAFLAVVLGIAGYAIMVFAGPKEWWVRSLGANLDHMRRQRI